MSLFLHIATALGLALAAGIRCIAVPNELTKTLKRPVVNLTVNSLADYDLSGLLAGF